MAESSISFLVEKLGALVSQQASLFGVVEGQVRQLRNELEWIRQFLEYADAERRYDKMFKLWVNQIRDAAFDAEDVIDEFVFNLEHKRQQRFNNLKFLNFLPVCVGLPDKLPLVNELNERISGINITLEKILINKGRYGMENPRAYEAGSCSSSASTASSSEPWKEKRVIPSTVEESNIVGMKNDVEAVKRKLLEGEMERGVVAIVGMGGLGKTTLAKKIYDDRDVQHHFDGGRAWVSVSQEFSIRELLLGIANCVTTLEEKQKHEFSNDKLGEEVNKSLHGKRYLIVLDDVWNADVLRWLSPYLPAESNKRSRVLITTRNEHIAVDAHSDCYKLQLLDEDKSWELFLNKVGSAAATWAGLEEFKEGIVAKCKGLPLAIVVLGGLLSLKDLTLDSWRKVFKSMDWHLSQGPRSCLGILALSYNNLPSHLKPCFLYCGVFPEDSKIKASKLIRLWIAEGFVQKRGKETLEEIAEDYLSELIQRSMIQVADTRVDGRVKSCRIHDLLRDLAISEGKEEKLFEVDENIDDGNMLPTSVRRLVSNIHHQIISSPHLQNSNLRSLILNRAPIDESWAFLQKYPKLLRVLHVDIMQSAIYGLRLSRKIGQLVHLKYLCLSGSHSEIIRLPPSIEGLINLQTLDSSDEIISIPHTIWKLRQMRHLTCRNGWISSRQSMRERWVYGHLGFHKMTNLQTLSLWSGDWLKDDNFNLGKVTSLKQLKLRHIDPRSLEGLFLSVSQLTGLQNLELVIDYFKIMKGLSASNGGAECGTMLQFPGLESFSRHKCLCKLFLGVPIRGLPTETTHYPPNLIQLKLRNTRLKEDPMSILGRLPNLRILTLWYDSYLGKKMNCPQGRFLLLEFLQIEELRELEDFSIEETAMPNLKTLKIQSCHKITRFPHGILGLEKLQRIQLYHVSQELKNVVSDTPGEDWNRIRLITSYA